jgi:hypothetical protein
MLADQFGLAGPELRHVIGRFAANVARGLLAAAKMRVFGNVVPTETSV